jgi:hypothetical protein
LSYPLTCPREGKPPMLSHSRLSRDPLAQALVRTRSEQTRGGGAERSRSKPPSYRHKLLHSSKFHGMVPYSPLYQSTGQYIPQSPTYPVPRVHTKAGHRRHPVRTVSDDHVDLSPFPTEADASAKSGSIGDIQDKHSTFSPYIGASEFTTACWNAWIWKLLHDCC